MNFGPLSSRIRGTWILDGLGAPRRIVRIGAAAILCGPFCAPTFGRTNSGRSYAPRWADEPPPGPSQLMDALVPRALTHRDPRQTKWSPPLCEISLAEDGPLATIRASQQEGRAQLRTPLTPSMTPRFARWSAERTTLLWICRTGGTCRRR